MKEIINKQLLVTSKEEQLLNNYNAIEELLLHYLDDCYSDIDFLIYLKELKVLRNKYYDELEILKEQ